MYKLQISASLALLAGVTSTLITDPAFKAALHPLISLLPPGTQPWVQALTTVTILVFVSLKRSRAGQKSWSD